MTEQSHGNNFFWRLLRCARKDGLQYTKNQVTLYCEKQIYSNMTRPSIDNIRAQVQQAINEDIGTDSAGIFAGQDVTASLISDEKESKAKIICREKAILCGQDWVNAAFNLLNDKIQIIWHFKDGDEINSNDVVCNISGNAQHILTAERTALNFLQTLSSTATQTHRLVKAVAGTNCKILDTRKTIPNLRLAQKYAVTCGGGVNHRIGLYDMVLIKENHIHAAGSITAAVNKARNKFQGLKIEIEVENVNELQQAIDNNVDRILLDNMNIPTLKQAVALTDNKIDLEASGNITLESIYSVAETGVDYISTGAITKNINATDYSLRFIEEN